jgi:hypothetical protein
VKIRARRVKVPVLSHRAWTAFKNFLNFHWRSKTSLVRARRCTVQTALWPKNSPFLLVHSQKPKRSLSFRRLQKLIVTNNLKSRKIFSLTLLLRGQIYLRTEFIVSCKKKTQVTGVTLNHQRMSKSLSLLKSKPRQLPPSLKSLKIIKSSFLYLRWQSRHHLNKLLSPRSTAFLITLTLMSLLRWPYVRSDVKKTAPSSSRLTSTSINRRWTLFLSAYWTTLWNCTSHTTTLALTLKLLSRTN